MPNCCHFTGVRLRVQDALVLDVGVARRRIAALRDELSALERLVSELGAIDIVKSPIYVGRLRTTSERTRRVRRIVCLPVARGFAEMARCPNLFEPLESHLAGRQQYRRASPATRVDTYNTPPESRDGEQGEPDDDVGNRF